MNFLLTMSISSKSEIVNWERLQIPILCDLSCGHGRIRIRNGQHCFHLNIMSANVFSAIFYIMQIADDAAVTVSVNKITVCIK